MEATEAGLQAAAATREAAKRKREQHEAAADVLAPKPKRARPIPVLKHEVEVPPEFDEATRALDPALHGGLLHEMTCQAEQSSHKKPVLD